MGTEESGSIPQLDKVTSSREYNLTKKHILDSLGLKGSVATEYQVLPIEGNPVITHSNIKPSQPPIIKGLKGRKVMSQQSKPRVKKREAPPSSAKKIRTDQYLVERIESPGPSRSNVSTISPQEVASPSPPLPDEDIFETREDVLSFLKDMSGCSKTDMISSELRHSLIQMLESCKAPDSKLWMRALECPDWYGQEGYLLKAGFELARADSTSDIQLQILSELKRVSTAIVQLSSKVSTLERDLSVMLQEKSEREAQAVNNQLSNLTVQEKAVVQVPKPLAVAPRKEKYDLLSQKEKDFFAKMTPAQQEVAKAQINSGMKLRDVVEFLRSHHGLVMVPKSKNAPH